MKKSLRLFATSLAIGFGALFSTSQAASQEVVLAESQYGSTNDFPIPLSWNQGATQTMYPSYVLDDAVNMDTYTVNELIYPLKAVPTSGKFKVSVYMASTADKALTNYLPVSAFDLVSDNIEIDCSAITDDAIHIPLLTPYEMKRGESMVIGLYATAEDGSAPDPGMEFQEAQFGDYPFDMYDTHTWYAYDRPQDIAFTGAMFGEKSTYSVAGLKISVTSAGGGGGGGAVEGKATLAESQYGSTNDFPIPLSWNQGATQTIYPSYVLDNAVNQDTYTVKELIYPLKAVPTSGKFKVSVYMASTADKALTNYLPVSAFDLVSDNIEIDCSAITDDAIHIPLLTPYEMKRGESMVIGLYATAEDGSAPDPGMEFQEAQFGDYPFDMYDTHTWYAYDRPQDIAFTGAMFGEKSTYSVAGLKISVTSAGGGGGGGAVEAEATLAESQYGSTNDMPFALSWNQGASQIMYPSYVLDAAVNQDTYTVKELIYPLKAVPTSGKFNVSVYMASTTDKALSNYLPVSDFTLVSENVEIDCSAISDDAIHVPLLTPFEMKRGESMVIGMYAKAEEDSAPTPSMEFQEASFDDFPFDMYDTHAWYTFSRPTNIAFDGASWSPDSGYKVAGLKIKYAVAGGGDEPVINVDLSATSVTAPEGEIYNGKAYEFSVLVKNEGIKTVEAYTVEIINTADDTVLGTTEVESPVYPNMNGRATVEATFAEPGTYSVAARVVMDGDEVADNNVTEPIEVIVEKLPYKAVEITGDAAPEVDTPATYFVKVANEGNKALEGYTVNLYQVRDLFADRLLASSVITPVIEPGESADVKFVHTFELAGDYTLKAEVVIGDGEPSFTPEFEVAIPLDDKITPAISEQVPAWNGSTHDFMGYAFFRPEGDKSASQILYPASYFGNHENTYQIQSIALTVLNEEYKVDPVELKISLAQTERTDGYTRGAVSVIPEEEFTLVYDGPLATAQTTDNQTVKFDLQKFFELDPGMGLAMNVQIIVPEDASTYYLDFAAEKTDAYYVTYSKNASSIYDGGNKYVSNQLPCIDLEYGLVPLPPKVDIAATSIEVTTEEPLVGEPVSFLVSFKNEGTLDVEEYSIELIDEENEVLATFEGTRYVAVGSSSTQSVKYTFSAAGEYNVAARIVVADDVDQTNNTTEAVSVTVAVPTVIDASAVSIELTSEEALTDNPVSFSVTVKNEGNVEIESYSIELVEVKDGAETVLHTYNGTGAIAVDASASQTVDYTFSAEGAYNIAARVVVAGDADDSNNTTAAITVNVASPVVVDAAAVSIALISDMAEVDKPVTFAVTVKNEGNVEIESYSIELVEVKDGEETVLHTYNGTGAIAVDASASQNIDYTFSAEGNYNVAARVVVAGDADDTNDTTLAIPVAVQKPDGIDGVIAEGTLTYDHVTSILRVNVGAGMLTIYDMAGHAVASYELQGAAALHLNLADGIYIITANGKTLKIRI